MASGERIDVRSGETTLAAERWPANGPTAVLLHAGVADRRSWYGVIDQLAGRVDLIAYDRPGFGETAGAPSANSDRDDLLHLLNVSVDGPVWLVGSSMGGGVALETVLAEPQRVDGLVLLAPAVPGAPAFGDVDTIAEDVDARIDAALRDGDLGEANRLETSFWLDGPRGPEARVGGSARRLAFEMNAIALANQGAEEAEGERPDLWSRLPEIEVPVTVVCGDLDVPGILLRSRALPDRLPHAHYVELAERAHLPYLEDPAQTAAILAASILP